MNIFKDIKEYVNDIEKKQKKENIVKDNQENVLLIKEKNIVKGKYIVYDNNKDLKYIVKGKIVSHKPYLNIYNKFRKKIATIQQNKRSFVLYERQDFIFKIGNKKIAIFSNKSNLLKEKYKIDNGWDIETKMFRGRFEIKDNDKDIATILFQNDKFTEKINFKEDENELFVLMIALAISMYGTINEKYMQRLSKEGSGC